MRSLHLQNFIFDTKCGTFPRNLLGGGYLTCSDIKITLTGSRPFTTLRKKSGAKKAPPWSHVEKQCHVPWKGSSVRAILPPLFPQCSFSAILFPDRLLTPMTITYVPKSWTANGHFSNQVVWSYWYMLKVTDIVSCNLHPLSDITATIYIVDNYMNDFSVTMVN